MILDINVKDVLFGRDKTCFNHVGNARFRLVISNHSEEYEHAPCRRDKSCIVYNVFNIVKSYEGRFLKRDGIGWKEVSDTEATQKVGHALRDKKQHEMRLRQKALKDEAKERSSVHSVSSANVAIAKKPTCSHDGPAVKKAKPLKNAGTTKESNLEFASALMKLGEICSHEMEQLKTEGSQRSSDSESDSASQASERNEVIGNTDETCASSILAMMGHRKRNGNKDGNKVLVQKMKAVHEVTARSSQDWVNKDYMEGIVRGQLGPGFDLEHAMNSSSNSVAQNDQLGVLTASNHQLLQHETSLARMSAEQSRAVTPPSLEGKQLLSGWTYYPLAIPNYALQQGGAWKLRLVQVTGTEGINLDRSA